MSSLRLRTPTLSKTLERWSWTVYSEMRSEAEICFVEAPRTTRSLISRSRGLKP